MPLCSLALKITAQTATFSPLMAQASHTVRNFTIGFIHLAMLGVVTGFLFFFLVQQKYLNERSPAVVAGALIFYAGFLCTELLLFAHGLNLVFGKGQLPNYFELLFSLSALLPIGLLLITISAVRQK